MIRFNIDYPGFRSGKTYQAKYAMHPFYGYLAIRVVDEDGDTRYIDICLLEDGSIVEVDDED
jgi:hypothetical protein|nr:MAG TPA: hypothetical protein [Caudoviricetes sp.]